MEGWATTDVALGAVEVARVSAGAEGWRGLVVALLPLRRTLLPLAVKSPGVERHLPAVPGEDAVMKDAEASGVLPRLTALDEADVEEVVEVRRHLDRGSRSAVEFPHHSARLRTYDS